MAALMEKFPLRTGPGTHDGGPLMAGSSLAVLDLVDEEMEVGQSIFTDHIAELVKAVRNYIASMAVA